MKHLKKREYAPPLTPEQLDTIKAMVLDGMSDQQVADESGLCTKSNVGRLRREWGIKAPVRREAVDSGFQRANRCVECKKACGGCPWSEWDEQKGGPAFQAVPGWTVEEYTQNGRRRQQIVACPLFEKG